MGDGVADKNAAVACLIDNPCGPLLCILAQAGLAKLLGSPFVSLSLKALVCLARGKESRICALLMLGGNVQMAMTRKGINRRPLHHQDAHPSHPPEALA